MITILRNTARRDAVASITLTEAEIFASAGFEVTGNEAISLLDERRRGRRSDEYIARYEGRNADDAVSDQKLLIESVQAIGEAAEKTARSAAANTTRGE